MGEQIPDDPNLYQDEPAPPGLMERPEVKEAVARALERVRTGQVRRGKTGEELLRELHERQALESGSGE